MTRETRCLGCGKSKEETPLLPLRYGEGELHICPQCLPTLIHQPEKLKDRLAPRP
ncbi:MAG: hypothetical protein WB626_06435 [Bacteroidota bacterium]